MQCRAAGVVQPAAGFERQQRELIAFWQRGRLIRRVMPGSAAPERKSSNESATIRRHTAVASFRTLSSVRHRSAVVLLRHFR